MRGVMASVASRVDRAIGPLRAPAYRDWQAAMADALTDPGELCGLLGLPPETAAAARAPADTFPLLVPRPYLARVRPGDPNDPLLLQILPRQDELQEAPGFARDPVGERTAIEGCHWLRKYSNRLLMVANGSCGVHCRFCFRRHLALQSPRPRGWSAPVLRHLAAGPRIREVILSGGDPLALGDAELGHLARQLADIPHLTRLRVHTRLPIVVPQRVDDALLAWLRGTRLATWLVVHVNHPAEIDAAVAAALGRLVDAGVPVLSQSVLLRGVNDRADVLAELWERLADLRVIPYYLHQLDRVAGAAHFEVPVSRGRRLIRDVRARLSGFAVPRYVREVPGRPNKVVLA